MSYTNEPVENPVDHGNQRFRFSWKLSQVLPVLFGVAVLLTVYKYIEQNYIAPKTEIVWQEFSAAQIEQALRQGRTVLLMVYDPDQTEGLEIMTEATRNVRVRRSVFKLNALAMKHEMNLPVFPGMLPRADENDLWVQFSVEFVKSGCLSVYSTVNGNVQQTDMHANLITPDGLAERLEEIEGL